MQVPNVLSFSFNATLGTAANGATSGGVTRSAAFPLFLAGERRAMAPWAGSPGQLPGSMREAYAPEQLQLLCVAQVRRGLPLEKMLRTCSEAGSCSLLHGCTAERPPM